MNQNFLLFLAFLWSPFFLIGQDYDNFLNGLLLEESTREPVAFATIRVKNKAIGVISNSDGSFRIPKSFQQEGEFLEVSSMGIETLTIAISNLLKNKINVFYLKPTFFELNESIVTGKLKSLSAKDIIRYAINNIKVNYPDDKFAYVGYYRDYQLKNDKYVNLNEAIIKVMDKGFMTTDTLASEFILYDYKKNINFEVDSFAAKAYDYKNWDKVVPNARMSSYGGNEFILMRVHDAIRNHRLKNTFSYVDDLHKDFIRNHDFILEGTTFYNNKRVYRISIHKKTKESLVEGIIFIDKANFAIRKFEYSLSQEETNTYKFNRSGPFREDFEENIANIQLLFKVIAEYKNEDEKMVLNYISFENKFEVVRPAKFGIDTISLIPENQVIEVKFNKPRKKNEVRNRLSNFKVVYGGEKVPLSSFHFKDDETLQLRVDTLIQKKRRLVQELFSRQENSKLSLSLMLKKIIDEEGNKIGKRESEYLHQFREFMVQEVVPFPRGDLLKKQFMIKSIPLHDKKQPKIASDDFQGYWMNTPLKKIEQ